MKIIKDMYAVFWSHGKPFRTKGRKIQFHADVGGKSPQEAVQTFRDMFPTDTVHSVRDASGRFLAFKKG